MERDRTSPETGDRLGKQLAADAEPRDVVTLRSERLISESLPTAAEIADARETLVIYLRHEGMPSELTDLSVDRFTARRLDTSGFVAAVELLFDGPMALHPTLVANVFEQLRGRSPYVKVDESRFSIFFNVLDGSRPVRLEAARFGLELGLLAGGLPLISVGPDVHRDLSSGGAEGSDIGTD